MTSLLYIIASLVYRIDISLENLNTTKRWEARGGITGFITFVFCVTFTACTSGSTRLLKEYVIK
jgi:hypothetical protein